MSVEVLCVGHACWDLGMSVERFPAENTKAESDALTESGGGPAANAAWLLGHWGVAATLAAVVGDDECGARVIAEMRQAGVDCRLLEKRPQHVTPVSFVLSNRANGSRTIITRKRPAGPLRLPPQTLGGLNPQVLLFDGHEPEAARDALEAFPAATSVFDAGSVRDGALELARQVQYLACSERFAAQVTKEANVAGHWRACLRQLRKLNNQVVVVTLGERGLIFDDGRQQGRLAPLPVKPVDTTAAGDIFHGAFAFALLRKMDLEQALRLATVAAGLSVQFPGGRPSIPSYPDVLRTLQHA